MPSLEDEEPPDLRDFQRRFWWTLPLTVVVTSRGTVFALEGSADLGAIRGALAAPIKGLGILFGTSVAGVF